MYKDFSLDYKMAVHMLFTYYNDPFVNYHVTLDTYFPWPPGCNPPTKHKPVFV